MKKDKFLKDKLLLNGMDSNSRTKNNIYVVFAFCLILVSSILIVNIDNFSKEDIVIKPLDNKQVDILVKAKLVPVYMSLKHDRGDTDLDLIYKTVYGDCDLYRDVLGRYYCRW